MKSHEEPGSDEVKLNSDVNDVVEGALGAAGNPEGAIRVNLPVVPRPLRRAPRDALSAVMTTLSSAHQLRAGQFVDSELCARLPLA
jgi:hypothetical protein